MIAIGQTYIQLLMRTIGQHIRNARKQAGKTLQDVATAIGISKSYLSLIESDQRTASEKHIRGIEQALDIDDQRLLAALHWHNTPPEIRSQFEALARRKDLTQTALEQLIDTNAPSNIGRTLPLTHQIPIINSVAAGYPREFTDLDYPASVADEYVACPDINDPQAFAARVVGDSMMPDYLEGEVVVFSPALPTPSGSDCFIRFERDDETMFKRIMYKNDQIGEPGQEITLLPINTDFPSRVVKREDLTGIYKAAYVLRRV